MSTLSRSMLLRVLRHHFTKKLSSPRAIQTAPIQCRSDFCHAFSSSSTPWSASRTGEVDEDHMLHLTSCLLDASDSRSFDDGTWAAAQDVLIWWIHRRTARIRGREEEIVQRCFQLMDRMATELPKDEYFLASILDTNMLNTVVSRWKACVDRRSRRNHKLHWAEPRPDKQLEQSRGGDILSPSTIVDKVDRYRWCSLVQPNIETYNLILEGATNYESNSKSGAVFANSLLEKMIQVSSLDSFSSTAVMFNVKTVAIVCKAWANSRHPQAPYRSQSWLDRLFELYNKERQPNLRPNSILYSTVIQAWANAGNPIQAEQILRQQLEDYRDNGNDEARPDSTTFNVVLSAWSKTTEDKIEAPKRASTILKLMTKLGCKPDHYSFTSLLACYAKSDIPGAGKKAEAILRACLEGSPSDAVNEEIRNIHLPPSAKLVAYNTVLDAYARQGNAQRAEKMLLKLIDNFASDVSDVRPDNISFNSVITAWSKVIGTRELILEAPHRAEALLSQMREMNVQPCGATYASILQCWSRSKCETSVENIQRIINSMDNRYGQGKRGEKEMSENVKPNVVHYNIALKTLSASAAAIKPGGDSHRAVHQAHSLIEEMIEQGISPNVYTYRSLLHIVAGSKTKNKSELAQEVINQMTRSGFHPSVQDREILNRLSKSRATGSHRQHTSTGSATNGKS